MCCGIHLRPSGTTGTFDESIIDAVFAGEKFLDADGVLTNVNAFATRADDARAVGTFVHDAIDNGMIVSAVDRLGEEDGLRVSGRPRPRSAREYL